MDQNLPFTPTLNPISPMSENVFSPVSKLFRTTWDRVQKNLLKLFLLTVAMVSMGVLLFIISALVMIAVGFFSPVTAGSPYSSATMVTVMGLILIVFVAAMIGMMALNIATIILLAETQPALSVIGLYKSGLKKIGPVITVSLLSGFIVLGGLVIFIIPGILFSILLSLAVYYVVLDNISPLEAMRKSAFAVSKNFGVVFIRMAALFGFSFIVGIILNLLSSQSGTIALFGSLASLIFNLIFGWFSVAYMMFIFQEAKKAAGDGKGKLLWMVVLAAVGWIIIAGISYLIVRTTINNQAASANIPALETDDTLIDLELIEEDQDTLNTIVPSASASASVRPTATPRASVTPRASAATSSANR